MRTHNLFKNTLQSCSSKISSILWKNTTSTFRIFRYDVQRPSTECIHLGMSMRTGALSTVCYSIGVIIHLVASKTDDRISLSPIKWDLWPTMKVWRLRNSLSYNISLNDLIKLQCLSTRLARYCSYKISQFSRPSQLLPALMGKAASIIKFDLFFYKIKDKYWI